MHPRKQLVRELCGVAWAPDQGARAAFLQIPTPVSSLGLRERFQELEWVGAGDRLASLPAKPSKPPPSLCPLLSFVPGLGSSKDQMAPDSIEAAAQGTVCQAGGEWCPGLMGG